MYKDLKFYLVDYVESITEKSKGQNMYICPLCGSGTGKSKTGAFSIYGDGDKWKCHSCGFGGDVFDLWGKLNGTDDHSEQYKGVVSLYGSPANQNQPKIERKKETKEEPEADYTNFFLQANKNLNNTDYHRGLSLETLNQFQIGYVEKWRHPKAPDRVPFTPRLIIPTSKSSYLARDTRPFLPTNEKDYEKAKVGKVHIFNEQALYTAKQPVFVVEGELDALSIIDVGGEAIALGSASNRRSLLAELKNRNPNQPLILALDRDEAGRNAEEELAKGFEELNISFYRVNITDNYKDANDILSRDKPHFEKLIEEALQSVKRGEREKATEIETELEALKKEAVAYSLQGFIDEIKKSQNASYMSTGFGELDNLLDGGLYAGLYVVGAISSLGKTTLCLQIADQIAQRGQDVIIFSLEMAQKELIAKSLSRLTFMSSEKKENAKTTRGILTGSKYRYYSQTEKDIIADALKEYSGFSQHIYINEGVGDLGVEQIKEKVKRHFQITRKAPVVVIDYLQILAPADPRYTDKQNTDKAVLELKRLSRDFNIPVIGISSFNRDNYNEPVNLSSFKESGAIEYSSDVLIGLQYKGMDYEGGESDKARKARISQIIDKSVNAAKAGRSQEIEVKILKNRNGSKGKALFDFFPMFNYFEETEDERKIEEGGWTKIESDFK